MIATTLVWSVVFACYKSHRDIRESELKKVAVDLISERERKLNVLRTALELDGQRAAGLSDQLKIIKEELKTVRNELDREREARQKVESELNAKQQKARGQLESLQQTSAKMGEETERLKRLEEMNLPRRLGQLSDRRGRGPEMRTDW